MYSFKNSKIDMSLQENQVSEKIVAACIEVHRHIGPGLLESAFEECLCRELSLREIEYERQKKLPVDYKGVHLDCGYRMDMIVEDCVVLELKSVKTYLPIHKAQLLSYLKLADKKLGLLINFNVNLMVDGIKRVANKL